MPVKKGLKSYERKTEATVNVKPRLAIVESVMMKTAPVWSTTKKKFVKGVSILQACAEEGITDVTFRNWRYEDKKIGDYYNNLIKSRKEMLHSMMEQSALNNVMEGINGDVKLRPMDRINISLRYLEKTSAEFNPAIKLDVENVTNPLLSMNKQEMEQRIMELSASLNLNVTTDNDNNGNKRIYIPSISPTTDAKEQDGNGEDESLHSRNGLELKG